jgi:hypothetical protein
MNLKIFIVLFLLLPVYWEEVLPSSAVEFSEHMVEMGEHCFATLFLTAPSPLPHGRDRPPPRFYLLSQSIRAPPTLILA